MRSTKIFTRVFALMLLSVFTILATGCGKKDAGGPDCGALYDKMATCGKEPGTMGCGLGLKAPAKEEWLKRCNGDADSKAAWTDVVNRCMKRDCKDFCNCLSDTLARKNGIKDAKEWDVMK